MVVRKAQPKVIAVTSARKMLEPLSPAFTSVYTHVRILLQLVCSIYRCPFSLEYYCIRVEMYQNEEEKKIITTHDNLERICLTKQRREWERLLDGEKLERLRTIYGCQPKYLIQVDSSRFK
jgi:hypothetical protein